MKCLFALVVARGWMNLSNRLKLFWIAPQKFHLCHQRQGSCKWCSIIVVQYLMWVGGWWENTTINCFLFLTRQKWAIHSHPVANWLFNHLCKDFLVFSADRYLVCDPTNAFGGLQDDSWVKADLCDCFRQVGESSDIYIFILVIIWSLYLCLGGLLMITLYLYLP